MTCNEGEHKKARDMEDELNRRQEFEHQLIDRKTTWGLTTQGILFAAYGVTFGDVPATADVVGFREIVACVGLAVAGITVVGILGVIRSKYLSWKMYRDAFRRLEEPREVPWGVNTFNTIVTLAPDALLPTTFVIAWSVLKH